MLKQETSSEHSKTDIETSEHSKRGTIARFILLALLACILLSVLSLLVLTTPWGLRKVVLPLASHASGLRIEAAQIEFFKQHTLEVAGFFFEQPGSISTRLHHGFIDLELNKIFHGEYSVSSLFLDSLSVQMDAAGAKKTEAPPPSKTTKSEAISLPAASIKNAKMRNSTFIFSDGKGLTGELKSISIDIPRCSIGLQCETRGRFRLTYKQAKAAIDTPEGVPSSQSVEATVNFRASTQLNKNATVENYSVKAGLEPLTLSGLPVAIDKGALHLEVIGKKFFEAENQISLKWAELSVPKTMDSSDGLLKTRLSFSPEKFVKFSKTDLQFLQDEKAYSAFSGEGLFEFTKKKLSGTFAIQRLSDRFLKLFPAAPPDIEILEMKAELKPSLSFDQGVLGQLEATLNIEDLQLTNPRFPPETLRGSDLSAVVTFLEKKVQIDRLNTNVLKDGQKIFDLAGSVSVSQPLAIQADVKSEKVLVEELQTLTGKKEAERKEQQNQQTSQENSDQEIRLPSLPPLEVKYQAAEVDSEAANFKALQLDLRNGADQGKRELSIDLSANGGSALIKSKAKASSSDDTNVQIAFQAETAMLRLKELLKSAEDLTGGADPGTIKSLLIDLTMSGKKQSELYRSLAGEVDFHSTDIELPSKFQNIPPFNLIFIPLDLIANITGKTAGFLLPEQLTKTATGLRSSLSEKGRISINKVDLTLAVKDQKVEISEGLISPNLLPGMEYTGTVGLDGSLDLRVFLTILGVRIPLPIAGSIDSPLPNAVRFVPELIRGLGLSALDVVGEGVGVIEHGIDTVRGKKREAPR